MMLARTAGAIPFLYSLLFLETVLWGLFEPGRNAVIPNIVKAEDNVKANTLSALTWSFNFTSGAALGGLIAVFLGRQTVFVLDSLSFVASALLIGRMRFAEPHSDNLPPVRARDLLTFTPILEGIRYVRGDARLTATLFAKCGLGMLGANWVIVPLFGERIFPVHFHKLNSQEAGMLGMSALMTSRGAGALMGPLLGTRWTRESADRLRIALGFGFAAALLGYVALSFAPALGWASASLIVAHGGLSMVWVSSTSLLQMQTEDRFRGRVFSAEFGFAVLTMSLSSYTAGELVDHGVPVRTVALLTGLVMSAPLAAWTWAQRFWKN
jgi:hypothetical protein